MLNYNSADSFPILESERLRIDLSVANDAEAMMRLRSEEQVLRYVEITRLHSKEEALTFIQERWEGILRGEHFLWAIRMKGNKELIGSISLWHFSEDMNTAELGYMLLAEYHGKGIMSEAISTVLDFGFNQLQFQMIEAFTHSQNEPSKAVLFKHGFTHEPARKDDKNKNNWIYELRR